MKTKTLLLFSKQIMLFLLIFVFLPLTILHQMHSKPPEDTLSESKGIFDETLVRGPRVSRSLEGFKFRTINSAPCAKPGTYLNEKRKSGRWYWYCYYDDRGNLAWMAMRCPNKRLFDPAIQKCVVNLTSTTEAAATTEKTTLSTASSVTLSKVESTAVTTSSTAIASSGSTESIETAAVPSTDAVSSTVTASSSVATTPSAVTTQ